MMPATTYAQALPAVLRRELRTILYNRYVQVFAGVIVAGSLAVSALTAHDATLPFAWLMLLLYTVPLFALLTGVSAAHEELEEQAFLMSQPVPRFTYVAGKFITLSGLLIGAVLLAFVGVAGRIVPGAAVALVGLGVALVVMGVSTGLAVGQYVRSRARGLMVALLVWFVGLVFYDGLTLLLAGVPWVQDHPALWVAGLLLNPIDAVRLTGLLVLGDVPFTVPGDAAWMQHVLTALPVWTGVLALGWSAGALALARRRTEHHAY